ncbi:MAG TPA: CAP domain-containing protein [Polyangia bacterium]|nr:CAP domain-containing protein [Polyangia bacterium]
MRGRALVAVLLVAACASTKTSTSTSTPTSTSTSTPTSASASATQEAGFSPAGEGAKKYATTAAGDGRQPAPADELRRALLAEVRAASRKQGRKPPDPDARLDWAMTDLARQVRGDDLPALDVVDFLLAHYGLVEPSPHILLSSVPTRGAAELSAHTRGEIAAMLRSADIHRVGVGVDRSDDTIYIALALQERRVELLDAIPRRLPTGGHAPLSARIAPGLTKPEIAITAPDGSVREQTPPLQKGVVRADIQCAGDGRYQVEIVATDATGSAVLANFPVYCGVAPPAAAPRGAGVRPAAVTAEEAEQQLLALINRDRKRAGVPPVVADDKLTAIARAHTHDMVDHDFVGHVSPRTGGPVDRVHRGGLQPTFVSENVGRGYTAEEAQQGFMSSPGHRANVVDPRPRRVGIGVVYGAAVTGTKPMFVTQLFTN